MISKRVDKIEYKDISHYDIEKGVVMKLKGDTIVTMDNSNAINLLSEKLRDFGIPKIIVNRHNKPYMKTHG